MTNLINLKQKLKDNSIVVIGEKEYFSTASGIKPIVDFYDSGVLKNAYVLDKIIGKAASIICVLGKVKGVYAKVLSSGGKKILEENNIPFIYDTVVDNIINRNGNDICPMEKAVLNEDNFETALLKIKQTIEKLNAK